MAMSIAAYGNIQAQLEKAKEGLRGLDDNLKRITGRDPTEMRSLSRPSVTADPVEKPGEKKPMTERRFFHSDGHDHRERAGERRFGAQRGPPAKRFAREGVFSRLGAEPGEKKEADSGDEEELPRKPIVSSRVIAPVDEKKREDVLAQQTKDKRSRERNRRMFGALLGTLQKFRQEETQLKDKEEKRAKIEQKLDEAARIEKENVRKERQELFQERKTRQQEIRRLEFKMFRIREHEEWEVQQQQLSNFIKTTSNPPIYYLPRIHNAATKQRLVESREALQELLATRRKELEEELEEVEARAQRALARASGQNQEVSQDKEEEWDAQDDEDIDMDDLSAAVRSSVHKSGGLENVDSSTGKGRTVVEVGHDSGDEQERSSSRIVKLVDDRAVKEEPLLENEEGFNTEGIELGEGGEEEKVVVEDRLEYQGRAEDKPDVDESN